MSNASIRAKGAVQELGGKIKGAVGKLLGDEEMQAEGKASEIAGEAKQEAIKAVERGKGKLEELVGAAKHGIGAALDDGKIQAEGKATELKGEVRQKLNQ